MNFLENHPRVTKLSSQFYKIKSPVGTRELYYNINREKRPIITQDNVNEKKGIKNLSLCPFCNIEQDLAPLKWFYLSNKSSVYFPSNNENYKLFKKAKVLTVNNLYEIIPYIYWKEKYNLRYSSENIEKWKDFILSIKKDFFAKLKRDFEFLFYGQHNINIYAEHLDDNGDFVSKDKLDINDLDIYYYAGLDSIFLMQKMNSYSKHIIWFENFLTDAGASIYHLHRQLLAVDYKPENIFFLESKGYDYLEENLIYPAIENNLLVKKFGNVFIFIGIGYDFPTLEILIFEKEDLKTVLKNNWNDLLKALFFVYRRIGKYSFNEIFYYSFEPKFYPFFTIHLRSNKLAGFEIFNNYKGISNVSFEFFKNLLKENPSEDFAYIT